MALKLSDTVFAGFGVIRREPLNVLGWGVAYIVMLAVAMVGMVALLGGRGLFNPAAATDPANAMNVGRAVIGVFLLLVPLFLLIGAVMNCAVYRTVLRPEQRGFARLRIGGDEGRMMLVLIMVTLLFIVGYIVCAIVGLLLAMAAGVIGRLLMVLVVLGYFAWFYTIFSFAGPMTFAKRKFLLFAGTDLARKQFWPLLGSYLLVGLIVVLLYLVAFGMQMAVVGIMTGDYGIQALAQHNWATGNLTAASVVSTVLGGVIGTLFLPIMVAPAAVAYRDMAGPEVDKQAEIFA